MTVRSVPLARPSPIGKMVDMQTPIPTLFHRTLWYVRAGWPPLMLALVCAVSALAHGAVWWIALCLLATLLLVLDSRARYREFLELRHSVRVASGLSGQALARFRAARSSWCTRHAALAAAQAEGFGADARALVASWGYKPWNVFPDRAFSSRSPFFRVGFWRSVLGLRRE